MEAGETEKPFEETWGPNQFLTSDLDPFVWAGGPNQEVSVPHVSF